MKKIKTIDNIRTRSQDFKNSRCFILRVLYHLLRIFYNGSKFLFIKSYRLHTTSRILHSNHFHQLSTYTEEDRYPELFEICKEFLKNKNNQKILSFGCSTGEEVFSLNEYLTQAQIIGTDINKWCINECRKKNKSANNLFVHSKSKKFSRLNNFDAIFCMAVFQHPENREDVNETATKYSFERFEKEIVNLDKKLKVGGLLIIDHCDFNLMETIVAINYEPLKCDNNKTIRDRPVYNSSNQRISSVTYLNRVFVKMQ